MKSSFVTIVGPRVLNTSSIREKKTIGHRYPANELVKVSGLFSEEILINGNMEIDLTDICLPEEFNCLVILLNSLIYPESSFVTVDNYPEFITGSIDLLLKIKCHKPFFDYFMI